MYTIWVNDFGTATAGRVTSNQHQASSSYGQFDSYQEASDAMNSDKFLEWFDANYEVAHNE